MPLAPIRTTRHIHAFAFKLRTRAENGRVLDSAGDDMARADGGAHHPHDREVVGFGAAGGENQLFGIAPDQRGYLPARGFETLFRKLAEVVNA